MADTPQDTSPQVTPEPPAVDTAESVQADTPAPASAEPAAPASTTPWQEDLAKHFSDPTQRQQVDEFLRDTVQPYVTQLEQKSAPNRDAERLYEDFTSKPFDTYTAITQELFGDEVASDILDRLAQLDSTETPTPADQAAATQGEIPEQLKPIVEDYYARQQQENYDKAFDKLVTDNPDTEINKDLFHPFVVASQGDLDTALVGYQGWLSKAEDNLGIKVPGADQIADAPPPTLGGDSSTPASTPQEQNYASIDEAMDAFLDENAAAPPVV